MKATAVILIDYEVDAVHASDPDVARVSEHVRAVLHTIAHRLAEDGVRVGGVRAATVDPATLPPLG